MVYLRSEEHLSRWLGDNGWEPGGATLSAVEMNELSRAWWWTRLDERWMPRSADESQAILTRFGHTGEFWQLG